MKRPVLFAAAVVTALLWPGAPTPGQGRPALRTARQGEQPSLSTAQRQERELQVRLRQANAFLREGKHDEALSILLKLQEEHPHDGRVVRSLNNLYQSMGRFDDSIRLLESEIAQGKSNYLIDLAEIHKARGMIREMVETVFRYLDKHPARQPWARDMVESLIRRGEVSEEDLDYLEDQARRREDPGVLRLVADAYVFAGRHREGLELLHEADVKADAHGRLLFPLAHVLRNRQAPDLALEVVRLTLEMHPADGLAEEALLTRARILADTGRSEAAIEAYEDMLTRFPEGSLSRRALMEEATLRRDRLTDYAAARRVYGRLVGLLETDGNLSPKEPYLDEARLGLAECALLEGLWDEAESTFVKVEQTAESRETREKAAFHIAETRFYRGDLKGAELAYFTVTDSFPGGAWVNDSIQRILFLQEHALAVPGDLSTYTEVLMERRRGRPDSALVLAREAIGPQLSADLVDEFLFEEIQSLLDLSRWDEAVDRLEAWPDSLNGRALAPRAIARVAEALTDRAGRLDEGIALYEDLLVSHPMSLESRRARTLLPELRRRAS